MKKLSTLLFAIMLFTLLPGCKDNGGSSGQSTCGDGICDSTNGETLETCSQDCPASLSAVVCGDGNCESDRGENYNSCPKDCSTNTQNSDTNTISPGNETPPETTEVVCGDGVCDASETSDTCAADCEIVSLPAETCGNGTCGEGETAENCEADCKIVVLLPACGDGTCSSGETSDTCSQDCGTKIYSWMAQKVKNWVSYFSKDHFFNNVRLSVCPTYSSPQGDVNSWKDVSQNLPTGKTSYIGTYDCALIVINGDSILVYKNDSWLSLMPDTIKFGFVYDIFIDDKVIYAATDKGPFKYESDNWSKIGTTVSGKLTQIVKHNQNIIVTDGSNTLIYKPDSSNWQLLEELKGYKPIKLFVNSSSGYLLISTNEQVIFAFDQDGIYKTLNGYLANNFFNDDGSVFFSDSNSTYSLSFVNALLQATKGLNIPIDSMTAAYSSESKSINHYIISNKKLYRVDSDYMTEIEVPQSSFGAKFIYYFDHNIYLAEDKLYALKP